ncbi:MAG: TrmH family RNA methyltransferase [Thermoguttaceae bacterium]
MTITSLQNPRIKNAVHLRDRRQRDKQRRIVIDGAREILRALDAGVRLAEAFVCESLCRSDTARRVMSALQAGGVETLDVSEAVFDRIAFGARAEGVLGVADTPDATLGRLRPRAKGSAPLVAVLEGVEKPGNVGAVLRSADGAGVSALVVADGRTDLYNPNAIRASLGTIFTLPIAAATTEETLDWLRAQGLVLYAARVDGSIPYTQVDYRLPAAVVLGSEAEGLSGIWHGDNMQAIRLPMLGRADSLNVSAAAAVLFYEALRQRQG